MISHGRQVVSGKTRYVEIIRWSQIAVESKSKKDITERSSENVSTTAAKGTIHPSNSRTIKIQYQKHLICVCFLAFIHKINTVSRHVVADMEGIGQNRFWEAVVNYRHGKLDEGVRWTPSLFAPYALTGSISFSSK